MNIVNFVSTCFKPGFTRLTKETIKLNEIQTETNERCSITNVLYELTP